MLTDYEFNQVKSLGGTWSIGHVAAIYSLILRRPVTIAEARNTLDRIWALQPYDPDGELLHDWL